MKCPWWERSDAVSAEPGSLGVREDATDGVAVELEERNLDMGGAVAGEELRVAS